MTVSTVTGVCSKTILAQKYLRLFTVIIVQFHTFHSQDWIANHYVPYETILVKTCPKLQFIVRRRKISRSTCTKASHTIAYRGADKS